jgi:hypothetical protein
MRVSSIACTSLAFYIRRQSRGGSPVIGADVLETACQSGRDAGLGGSKRASLESFTSSWRGDNGGSEKGRAQEGRRSQELGRQKEQRTKELGT